MSLIAISNEMAVMLNREKPKPENPRTIAPGNIAPLVPIPMGPLDKLSQRLLELLLSQLNRELGDERSVNYLGADG